MTYEELFIDAYLVHKNKVYRVKDQVDNALVVVDENAIEARIGLEDWLPLNLTDEWLTRFGLGENCVVICRRNNCQWVIRKSGTTFYATIYHHSYEVAGICWPLNYVHELQELYSLLIGLHVKRLQIG